MRISEQIDGVYMHSCTYVRACVW